MTTRTQIYLPSEDHKRARLRATEQGISLAEYVRRLVRDDLAGDGQGINDVSTIFGIGSSGGSNIARLKDTYLAEALEAHRRK